MNNKETIQLKTNDLDKIINENDGIRLDEAIVLALSNELGLGLNPKYIPYDEDNEEYIYLQVHGVDIQTDENNIEVKSLTLFRKEGFYFIALDIQYFKRRSDIRSPNKRDEIMFDCFKRGIPYAQRGTNDSDGWLIHADKTDILIGVNITYDNKGKIKVIRNFQTLRYKVQELLEGESYYRCLTPQYISEGNKVTCFLALRFDYKKQLKNILELEYDEYEFIIIDE